jgi:Cu/Ag efflux pump CusA
MADAVIGGLILSTALSLLVVPAFYVVADRLRGKKAATAHEPTPSAEHAQ